MTQVNFTILFFNISTTSLDHPSSSSDLKNRPGTEGEDEVKREGTYLKVMVKKSVLVWNNVKHKGPSFMLPYMIYQRRA